tara:strand:- start:173 stop:1180 length:1008 start_codon:yes stop_codon:yes gene_type:complete
MSMNDILEGSALQFQNNARDYAKQLATDNANSVLQSFNEAIGKATGISDMGGLISGGIVGVKGIKDSIDKAKDFYDKLQDPDIAKSDINNLIDEIRKSKQPNLSDITDDLQERTKTLSKPIENITKIQETEPEPEPENIRYRGVRFVEPKEQPQIEPQELSNEEREQQIRNEIQEYKNQSTQEQVEGQDIDDDFANQFTTKIKPVEAFTQGDTGKFVGKSPIVTGDELEGGTKSIIRKSAENEGIDLAGDVTEGLGIGAIAEGGLDIFADVGFLGTSLYTGIKSAIDKGKASRKEEQYDADMKRANALENQTNPITDVVGKTITQTQLGGVSQMV